MDSLKLESNSRAFCGPANGKSESATLAELAVALAEAIRLASSGAVDDSTTTMQKAVSLLRQVLGLDENRAVGRGRRPQHDREFAIDSLISIVGTDPDGLSLSQGALVRKLSRRFADAGKAVPGSTWLKEIISDFKKRSLIHERAARERWQESSELKSDFESVDAFISFCRARDRLEEKWNNDKVLRRRFKTAGDYVTHYL
jgi:hypothetical protein